MRNVNAAVATTTLLLAACGGQGGMEAPAPQDVPLAYGVPTTNPVVFASADTMRFTIQIAPGQSLEQTIAQKSKLRMQFAPGTTPDSVMVTASYTEFAGSTENSMTGTQEIPLDAVAGQYVFALGPKGDVDVHSSPEIPAEYASMGVGDNRLKQFFPRLPGHIVTPGQSWVDTVHVENEEEGAKSTSNAIIHATFMGDTVINGRTVWVINSQTDGQVVIEGETQGMQMRNELHSNSAEVTWWDPARRTLLHSASSGTITGTFSLPAAGMDDIPIEGTTSRRIDLQQPAGG